MAQPDKIDVNTATREALVQGAGLRPALAEAIVRHREANGPFASVEALIEVSGIGAARLEQLKGVLTAAAPTLAEAAPAETAPAEPAPEPVATAPALPAEPEPVVVPAAVATEAAPPQATVEPAPALPPPAPTKPAALVTAAPAAPAPAAKAAPAAEGDLASFWLDLAACEMAHGLEAWRKLAAARSWPEAAQAQLDWALGSLDRLADATQRWALLLGRAATDLAAAGQESLKRAA